ncbi:MAG: hypothetical protein AB7G11_02515 [Phycisphaerales bacterium]
MLVLLTLLGVTFVHRTLMGAFRAADLRRAFGVGRARVVVVVVEAGKRR